ncbi:MAG: anti-sigma factor [Candidatus Zixiibacteriota bacterium]
MRKLLLFAVVLALPLMWGCSHQDNGMSSNMPDSGNQGDTGMNYDDIDPTLRAMVDEAIESEEYDIDAKGADMNAMATSYSWIHSITGPTVITEPGIYFVRNDFMTSDDAIVIRSDYVLLYLKGHMISGPGDKSGRGIVLEHASHCAVVGGQIKGFGIGVVVEGGTRNGIRSTNIVGNDLFADPAHGVAPQIGMMLVNSTYNQIIYNRIENINLGIFVRGGGSYKNQIAFNKVMGGDIGLLAICYNPDGTGDPAGPHNDYVAFNKLSRFKLGIQASAGAHDNHFEHHIVDYFVAVYEDVDGANVFYNNTGMMLEMPMRTLTLNFDGLDDLGNDFAYEGWVIVNGHPVSTGTFTVDGGGMPSQTMFDVTSFDLAGASKFVLTIEPVPDPDPAPAHTHYLAGDFSETSATLTIGDMAALGNDFMMAAGTFILNTPSTGSDNSDYANGIWWLDPMAGPGPTLDLPMLPAGWVYEGWVVGPGGPVTTGKFMDVSGFDMDAGGPTAGPDPVPPFPGQDYINPPMNLIGYAAVITVEPYPDNSADPFTLKPLIDGSIEDVGIGVPQAMTNTSANFPHGMASR